MDLRRNQKFQDVPRESAALASQRFWPQPEISGRPTRELFFCLADLFAAAQLLETSHARARFLTPPARNNGGAPRVFRTRIWPHRGRGEQMEPAAAGWRRDLTRCRSADNFAKALGGRPTFGKSGHRAQAPALALKGLIWGSRR